ncbi:MAG: hypothetical protein LBT95_03295, partial [Treponema sp.]|nr:hypothetical protein [Treponema sp.]
MFVKNSTGILKKVLLCRPTYLKITPINEIAKKWADKPLDLAKMEAEHRALVKAYEDNGVEVAFLEAVPGLPYLVFARDFGGCIREGYILGKFREPIRYEEQARYRARMEALGVPLVAEVK